MCRRSLTDLHLSSTLTYSRIFYAGKFDSSVVGDSGTNSYDDDGGDSNVVGSRPCCISATNDENDWPDNFATPPRYSYIHTYIHTVLPHIHKCTHTYAYIHVHSYIYFAYIYIYIFHTLSEYIHTYIHFFLVVPNRGGRGIKRSLHTSSSSSSQSGPLVCPVLNSHRCRCNVILDLEKEIFFSSATCKDSREIVDGVSSGGMKRNSNCRIFLK